MYKTGDNTRRHKWYHSIFYLKCLIIGHDTYCGFYNGERESFDYCRRCEKYNSDRNMKSLHLWARWIRFRVSISIWLDKHK